MAQLFISYSRKDGWARALAGELRNKARHTVFVDYLDIHGGADWWDTICAEIRECDALVYVVSPNSVVSHYCLAEVG